MGGVEDFRYNRMVVGNIMSSYVKYYIYLCKVKMQFPRLNDLIMEWDEVETKLRNSRKWGGCMREFRDICGTYLVQ